MKTNKIYTIENFNLSKKDTKSKKPEIIAWSIFFGIGISYFIITLLSVL